MDWDDVAKPTKAAIALGEDLTTLSISELTARIELLRIEITRIEAAITAKQHQSAAADALFRK
jgi:uncharacterized small protein (DUF1192 family)